MTTPFGIDVSQWNTVTSWQQVKADGIAVAIIKATEGTTEIDPDFAANWSGAAVIGNRVPYHFGHPGNDPLIEAQHFLTTLAGKVSDARYLMLDLEVTDGLGYPYAAHWADSFCGHLHSLSGKEILFYSSASFIHSMGTAAQPLTAYDLFMAAWGSVAPNPAPWPKWTLWQSSSTGSIPGVYGQVDIDQIASGALSVVAPSSSVPKGVPLNLAKPVSVIALTPSGQGYWLFGQDGGVFAYGDAKYFSSLPDQKMTPAAPIIGGFSTPAGDGYSLVGADGGVFVFGAAKFFGSMGGKKLNAPIVGGVGAPDGLGYVLVASDGGVFPFGDVAFEGSPA